MAVLYTNHFVQFFDDNGNPLSNGKLYAYFAGTTTPKATYTTEEATVENSNPVILDSSGRATVFIEGSYRFDLYDHNNVLIKSTDDVTSFTTLNESGDPFFQSFSGNGSQTVFTLSESLGTDSKDIIVFVDGGGNEGYEIQNPSAYTLTGTSLTFSSAPASGTDNIYVFAPTKLLGAAAASAAAAAASEASAAASAASAAANSGQLEITSTTSVAISSGTKTFTVDADLALDAGQWVIITSDANPSVNYMSGNISSYSSTTLEVNVVAAAGSGTLNDWTIKLSGVRGPEGTIGTLLSDNNTWTGNNNFAGGTTITDSSSNDILKFFNNAVAGAATGLGLFPGNDSGMQNPEFYCLGSGDRGISFRGKGNWFFAFHASSAAPAKVRLYEQETNGNEAVGLVAPASVAITYDLTLPDAAGAANDLLYTSGSGVLKFGTPFSGLQASACVNGAGTLLRGSGLSVSKGSTGTYTVTLATATPDTATPIQVSVNGGGGPLYIVYNQTSTTSITVNVFNTSAVAVDPVNWSIFVGGTDV